MRKFVPKDFDLGLDDLEPFILNAEFGDNIPPADQENMFIGEAEPQPPKLEVAEPPEEFAAAESEAEPEPVQEPIAVETADPMARFSAKLEKLAKANARCDAAKAALSKSRLAANAAREGERSARARLAAAVQDFQIATGARKPTPDELRREYVTEENRIRQAIGRGGGMERPAPRNVPGRSAIDRTAFYSKGGNPAGQGNAFRRGSMTLARSQAVLNAAAAPKLPSQR